LTTLAIVTIIEVMKSLGKFAIVYAPVVKEHLKSIDRKYYSLIRKTIEQQLMYEPGVETRNRKPLKRLAPGARWEIRFGRNNRFRVFYRAEREKREVEVLAIGEKRGNRLVIGGEEIEL